MEKQRKLIHSEKKLKVRCKEKQMIRERVNEVIMALQFSVIPLCEIHLLLLTLSSDKKLF